MITHCFFTFSVSPEEIAKIPTTMPDITTNAHITKGTPSTIKSSDKPDVSDQSAVQSHVYINSLSTHSRTVSSSTVLATSRLHCATICSQDTRCDAFQFHPTLVKEDSVKRCSLLQVDDNSDKRTDPTETYVRL